MLKEKGRCSLPLLWLVSCYISAVERSYALRLKSAIEVIDLEAAVNGEAHGL